MTISSVRKDGEVRRLLFDLHEAGSLYPRRGKAWYGRRVTRFRAQPWALCCMALVSSGACERREAESARRALGNDPLPDETKKLASEPIDAHGLDKDAARRDRVLTMRFEEVVARLGFVEYRGVANFRLTSARTLSIVEDTTLRQGLAGSFQIVQKDEDGNLLRETIYNNGVHFIRNGPGKMYVQGMIKGHHLEVRDEAWQPLRVYTRYFGPRIGLEERGTATAAGRPAVKYAFLLLEGGPVAALGQDEPQTPKALSGELLVDEASGVPMKCNLEGSLEVPIPGKNKTAELALSLAMSVRLVEGEDIKPTEFLPAITRHPVDLDPLAFLDGGTRTSTVIGGGKSRTKKPSTKLEPDPDPLAFPDGGTRTSTAIGKKKSRTKKPSSKPK